MYICTPYHLYTVFPLTLSTSSSNWTLPDYTSMYYTCRLLKVLCNWKAAVSLNVVAVLWPDQLGQMHFQSPERLSHSLFKPLV